MTSDDESEAGQPIELLADLEEPVSARVRKRVRSSIQRRQFGGDLLDFTIITPGMVLVTYVTSLFGALVGPPSPPGNETEPPSHRTTRDEP